MCMLSGRSFHSGLVSKPKSKAEEEGKHKEGTGETSSERSSRFLLRRSNSSQRAKAAREVSDKINLQIHFTLKLCFLRQGETTEEIGESNRAKSTEAEVEGSRRGYRTTQS